MVCRWSHRLQANPTLWTWRTRSSLLDGVDAAVPGVIFEANSRQLLPVLEVHVSF